MIEIRFKWAEQKYIYWGLLNSALLELLEITHIVVCDHSCLCCARLNRNPFNTPLIFSPIFAFFNMWLIKKYAHFVALPHQDAASLSVAILKKKFRGQIFVGCDNHPLSRLDAFCCQMAFWFINYSYDISI